MLTVIISHFFEQDMIFLPFATSLLKEQNFERAPMQRKTCSSGGFPWNKTDQQRFHKNWEIIACSASKELLWLFWLVLVYWTGVLLGQKIRGSDSGTFFLSPSDPLSIPSHSYHPFLLSHILYPSTLVCMYVCELSADFHFHKLTFETNLEELEDGHCKLGANIIKCSRALSGQYTIWDQIWICCLWTTIKLINI